MPSIRQRGLAMLLAGPFLCAGQDVETPRFRTGTTLIEFNVVALDSHGKPVTDLKKEEIRITEMGKRRDVAFLRFERGSATDEIEKLPPGDFSNRGDRLPSLRRNVAAIALDSVNTAPVSGGFGNLQESNYQETTRAQILRYLHAVPPNTRTGLFRMESGHATMLEDFTDDIESLRARIAHVDLNARGQQIDIGFSDPPPATGEAAAAIATAADDAKGALAKYNEGVRGNRLQISLSALEALGTRMTGLPGRKSIVWMSVGMPTITGANGWLKSNAAAIQRTARRLASQGIAVYGVPTIAAEKYNPAMDVLAETTGGRVVRTINDPTEALSTSAADNQGVYTAAFYSTDDFDNKWHDVSLKVDRPGVKLTYRKGYLAEAQPTQPQDWAPERWRAAIYNSLGSSSLRLDARCHMGSGADAGTVFVAIKFELTDLLFRTNGNRRNAQIEVAYVEMKPHDVYNLQRRSVTLRYTESNGGSVQSAHNWKLDPEARTIRIILRDKFTGRYGTLDVPVKDIPGRR